MIWSQLKVESILAHVISVMHQKYINPYLVKISWNVIEYKKRTHSWCYQAFLIVIPFICNDMIDWHVYTPLRTVNIKFYHLYESILPHIDRYEPIYTSQNHPFMFTPTRGYMDRYKYVLNDRYSRADLGIPSMSTFLPWTSHPSLGIAAPCISRSQLLLHRSS